MLFLPLRIKILNLHLSIPHCIKLFLKTVARDNELRFEQDRIVY